MRKRAALVKAKASKVAASDDADESWGRELFQYHGANLKGKNRLVMTKKSLGHDQEVWGRWAIAG